MMVTFIFVKLPVPTLSPLVSHPTSIPLTSREILTWLSV